MYRQPLGQSLSGKPWIRSFLLGIRHDNFWVRHLSTAKGCGAYGIRTRDLLNAIEALYQLS